MIINPLDLNIRAYYRNLHLGRNIALLYTNRVLVQISSGMLAFFSVIFFYERFNFSFSQTMLLYGGLYFSYVLLFPLTAKLMPRWGLKWMIIVAIPFFTFAVGSLLLWDRNMVLSLSLFVIFVIVFTMLYWLPYHVDFAKFGHNKTRGKQMALMQNISEVVLAITPLVAGVVISLYSFNALFAVAALFVLISMIPIFFISDARETFTFGYLETFMRLCQKENRALAVAYMGDGFQSAVRMVIWPLFIYILLDGDYVAVGAVTALTIVVLIFLRFLVGNLLDHWSQRKLVVFGVFLASTGWFLKAFVETGVQIFASDIYHRLGGAVNRLSTDVVTYSQAADNGHYVDEFTVLKEMALNIGRSIMIFGSIGIVMLFGIPATFVVAALATLLMVFLNKALYLV